MIDGSKILWDDFENAPSVKMPEMTQSEKKLLEAAFKKLGYEDQQPNASHLRKLLVFPNQANRRIVGIRAQYVEDKEYYMNLGRQIGIFAKAVEWICRLLFGFGLAIVGRKYRRSVAFGLSSAMALQSGLQVVQYINGHFGGAVDQLLQGVTQTTQTFFGYSIDYATISSTFFTQSTGLWMGKYTINGYVPNPVLYNLYEVFFLIFFAALPIFLNASKNKRGALGVAKRMKDGYVIGCLVPLITSSVNCIVNIAWVGYFQGFAIFSAIVSVLLIIYLGFEVYRFVDPCEEENHYFNEDEAYLTFDCHPNSIPGGNIALIEYTPTLIYLLLPPLVYVLSNTGITTTIVFTAL